MRFIAFFAFVATASASQVYLSAQAHCHPLDLTPIPECDIHDAAAAKIDYEGGTVTFFKEEGCTGAAETVSRSSPCYVLFFASACLRIEC
jgi:hypothetical protein